MRRGGPKIVPKTLTKSTECHPKVTRKLPESHLKVIRKSPQITQKSPQKSYKCHKQIIQTSPKNHPTSHPKVAQESPESRPNVTHRLPEVDRKPSPNRDSHHIVAKQNESTINFHIYHTNTLIHKCFVKLCVTYPPCVTMFIICNLRLYRYREKLEITYVMSLYIIYIIYRISCI